MKDRYPPDDIQALFVALCLLGFLAAALSVSEAVASEQGPDVSILIQQFDGAEIARTDCTRRVITIRADFAEAASNAALVEVIAHEVAHLRACHDKAHGADWWREYRAGAF